MIVSGTHVFKTALFLHPGKIIKGPGELKVSRTGSSTGMELATLKVVSSSASPSGGTKTTLCSDNTRPLW